MHVLLQVTCALGCHQHDIRAKPCKHLRHWELQIATNSFLRVRTSLEWITRCICMLISHTVSHLKGSCCSANSSTCTIEAHGKTALYYSSCFPNFLMPSSSRRIFPAKRPGMSCPGVQISVSVAVYDGATVDPVLYSYQGCNCVSGTIQWILWVSSSVRSSSTCSPYAACSLSVLVPPVS